MDLIALTNLWDLLTQAPAAVTSMPAPGTGSRGPTLFVLTLGCGFGLLALLTFSFGSGC